MILLLTIFHFIFCFFLIGVILLQAGKGADIGAAFGAGGSQTVFGPRGAATLLSKITAVVAVLFLMTSVVLARYANQRSESSVFEKVPLEVPAAPMPTEPPLATPDTQK